MANNKLILRTVNSPYVGNAADFTKNSVLTHKEVDNNFVFLKGEDIITGSTSGTTLILTQVNNDIIEVDLLPILCSVDNFTTGATVVGSSLYFDTKDTLSAYTVDLSSFLVNTNDYVTGSTLVGSTLYFSRTDTLSAFTVDLSSISGDTNTDNFTTGTTVINGIAYFDRTNSLSAYTLDLTPYTADTNTNFYTTGATIIGNTAYFDRTDTLSAFTLDVSSLTADTNTNFYTTGTTLVDKTIYFDRTDTLSAFTTDLSGIIPDADYGNIIFVSEVGPTGLTRADVIGDITKPVDLEWASQIAQSGDTIHVKSGIYTVSTTSDTGLSVNGVNHIFEHGAKVYKTTSGNMFGKSTGFTECNVYGNGSFYGSGSCNLIFQNLGTEGSAYTQTFEWDECQNSNATCISSTSNQSIRLRGENNILSTSGIAIYHNDIGIVKSSVDVTCPKIESTSSYGFYHTSVGGYTTKPLVTITANEILGFSTTQAGVHLDTNPDGLRCVIKASYINYIFNFNNGQIDKDITIDVARVDVITNFNGDILNVNGHLGYFNGQLGGIVNVKLADRFWGAGQGVVNATFNGGFEYTGDTVGTRQITSISGSITCNFKLQKPFITAPFSYDYVRGWWMSFAGGTNVNFLGNWDIEDWWLTFAGGRVNIPSETEFYIGPYKTTPGSVLGASATGETFNFDSTTFKINGTIIESCDLSAPCDTSESATTYSNTLMYTDPDNGATDGSGISNRTRVIYNGATIIVRNQNSQLITTKSSATGATVGIYSGGLNTNKMDAFQAEKEKQRITVGGTAAILTVNGETFTSTTGGTASATAVELVNLINASGTVGATASQDIDGVDTYLYVESDTAGTPLTMVYGFNTILDVMIRYNTQEITDNVGGVLIEDENITRDLLN